MQETDVAELHLLEVLMGPVRLCWSKPVQTVKPTCGIPLSSLSGPRIAQSSIQAPSPDCALSSTPAHTVASCSLARPG